jgi:hypothetical protein
MSDEDDYNEKYRSGYVAGSIPVCLKCGAVVRDTPLHDEFHEALAAQRRN